MGRQPADLLRRRSSSPAGASPRKRRASEPKVEGLEGRRLLAGQGATVGVASSQVSTGSIWAADPLPILIPPPGTQTLTGVGMDILARTGSPIASTTFARFTYFVGNNGGGILDANGGATIDYGDGTPPEVGITHATVGPDGVGTIPVVAFLEHVYAHAGTYTIHVTYTYSGNPPSGTVFTPVGATTTATATVADDANVPDGTLHGTGVSFLARTGDPMVSTPLADFPAPIGAWGDATIDYGDGTPTEPGLLNFSGPYGANVYVISGQGHIYAHAGVYAVRVTFSANGAPGAVTSTATVADDANVPDGSIHGTGVDLLARTGDPIVPTILATFTAPSGNIGDATIDYGDGTPAVAGLVGPSGSPDGAFAVTGRGHVFAHAGTYTVRVSYTVNGLTATTTATATVADDANVPDGTLKGVGTDILASAGNPAATTVLARFTAPLGSWSNPMIDYGDGTPPVLGTLTALPNYTAGTYDVTGQGHVYAHPGTYTIRVTFSVDDAPGATTSHAFVTGDPAPNLAAGASGGGGQGPATQLVVVPTPLPANGATTPRVGPVGIAPAPTTSPRWLAAFVAKVEAGGHSLWASYQAHPDGLLASRLRARGAVHHHGASHGHYTAKPSKFPA